MRSLRRRATWAALSLLIGLSLALLMSVGSAEGISGLLELEPVNWLDIALRNGGVALLLVAGGLLAALPTVGILADNGFLVGSSLGVFLASDGGFARFLLLTVPHGVVELPALILFGAVGLGIASHVLQLLGIRSEPPRAASLAREAFVAFLMILVAAVLEAKLTSPLASAAWGGAANPWLDRSLRWSAILMVEGGALFAVSLLFDWIDRAPTPARRARARFGSLSAPVLGVVVAAICLSLNSAQFEIWRSTQSVWRLLIFALGCGLPPLLYVVARGYRAQMDEPSGGLSIHAPWLVRAALMIGGAYALLGAGYWIAPGLSPIARAFSTVIILLTLLSLMGPMLAR